LGLCCELRHESNYCLFFIVRKYSQMRWIWQVMLAWIVDCTRQHCSYFFSHNILCWHGGCCELVCLYHFPAFQCMIVMRIILSVPGWIWNWHVNGITKYVSMQKWSYLNHTILVEQLHLFIVKIIFILINTSSFLCIQTNKMVTCGTFLEMIII
jgi:hypothetical protein